MSRPRLSPPPPEPHLMAHVRAMVWGPAEFVGLPPWRLVGEGLLAGILGAAAIVGSAVAGVWYGVPALADGEAGLVCAAALCCYLGLVRAGRALIGLVAVLGVCLALQAPQAAVEVVPAERGRGEAGAVTSVGGGPAAVFGRDRSLCSASGRNGVLLEVRIRRDCGRSARPGGEPAVVHAPEGQVPPRGAETHTTEGRLPRGPGGWAAALVAGCVVAVARSYRLKHTA
ncbi:MULTISPECIES: hypothetical protein [Streptomyces]|uniref:hypothetical protein n=1 Tax=Streptomyces TaxID=1883 RepID=UPI000A9E3BBC|nr:MULTISPECIES: hypothetical protein [Streptomyces]